MLFCLVFARLVFHAILVPVWEGPDEPFHLARIASYADQPFWEAVLAAGDLPDPIAASIRAHPCGPDLQRAFRCPGFSGHTAAFNVFRASAAAPSAGSAWANPENNQPPLHYLVVGLLLRQGEAMSRSRWKPETRLLFGRLFSLLLITLAILGPLRALAGGLSAGGRIGALLLLLLPGFSEALVRCSNDAAVFLWCALALFALEHGRPGWPCTLLLALGPLIKLTAFPVVAVVLLNLWRRGQIRAAVRGALGTLTVFPVQALLRGWSWGGTYELNRPTTPINESLLTSVVGIVRSAYTFLKTVFWLGEWSFFRPPRVLVLVYFVLIAAWLVRCRLKVPRQDLVSHLAGAGVAVAGFLVFAVANRRLFGVWGGVGGWYFWTWFPWLLVAARDIVDFSSGRKSLVVAASLLFLLLANLSWFETAFGIYGV